MCISKYKRIKGSIYSIVLLIILISCQNEYEQTMSVTLEESSTKQFALDTLSAPSFFSYSYFKDNKTEYFTFLNYFTNSIYYYNYDSFKYSRVLKLLNEGPDGVGKAKVHMCLNSDTTFVYSSNRILYILNNNSKIKNKYNIRECKTAPDVIVNNLNPIVKVDNNLYLNGYGLLNKNSKVIINLKKNEIKAVFPFPEFIIDKRPVHPMYQFSLLCYNSKTNRFIFGFSADHNLYVVYPYTMNQYKKYNVRCGEIDIDNISFTDWNNQMEEFNYYFYHDSYIGTIYDKYNDVYYRFVRHKMTKEEKKKYKKSSYMLCSILILDNEFKIIGQKKLPRNYYDVYRLFINKYGLHMLKIDSEENVLTFGILKLKKNLE